ncbi:GtrA family protein, partial [Salmonella enterica subsp. enterica serovar Kentucky]|nr:GtrA family protein [Salmonella enterica]EBM8747082.1 GtrA family protein [Salmonella enterica subsp. enterica serovar Kentucky]HDV7033339.1 GtrA family protein [Salmonella enterica subsp. enterica]ECB5632674.1 GtrA family protein [Salmonella enterica subsp. enterica serovar Kentucky]EDI4023610.1 GtrA family protein [Salmonella enterica subsp. enterica serovar Kentucky]
LSAVVGWTGDKCAMPPIFTLIVFSAISLICGFLYSRFIVFRNEK